MSTAVYAVASTNRDNSTAKQSTKSQPPGMRSFLDALAALVPGEALALHALALNLYTGPIKGPHGKTGTQITNIADLETAFYVCLVMSVIVYLSSRFLEAVMNSIRKSLGMRETEIAREPSRLWNPHFYAIFAQVHNTL